MKDVITNVAAYLSVLEGMITLARRFNVNRLKIGELEIEVSAKVGQMVVAYDASDPDEVQVTMAKDVPPAEPSIAVKSEAG